MTLLHERRFAVVCSIILALFLTVFAGSFSSVNSAPSNVWNWQNPLPQGNILESVFVAENNVWAAGGHGTVIGSRDSGANWTIQPTGTDMYLSDMAGADGNSFWAVGYGGTIIRTTDGGSNWITQESATEMDLNGISAVDANTAWVVGDATPESATIRMTANGGTTWMPVFLQSSNLLSVSALSATEVWLTGQAGEIHKTGSGGIMWTEQDSGLTGDLNSISAIDTNTAWIAAYGGNIIKTTDGGANWIAQDSGTTEDLNGIFALDANTVWAVGDSGTILKTDNGGATWAIQPSGTSDHLQGVYAASGTNVWAVGFFGNILNTTDGDTWNVVSKGTTEALFGNAAVDPNTAWAVGGDGLILKTDNGGATWIPQDSGTANDLDAVSAADTENAWIVGRNGTVLNTKDGGQNWSLQDAGTASDIGSAAAVDADTAWIGDISGSVHKTTDGGATWEEQHSYAAAECRVAAADSKTAWAAFSNGLIWKTTDGGATWEEQAYEEPNTLFGIAAVDANTAWAVGWNGTILNTTDGGATWHQQDSRTGVHLFSISASDSENAWAVGLFGTIVSTSDGGANWTLENSGTDNMLHSVSTVDKKTAWVVGRGGTILQRKEKVFYFAEGTTIKNFHQYLCLGNPQANDAYARVTFLYDDGTSDSMDKVIPAKSRATINVNDTIQKQRDLSIKIETSDNIVAERPMYFNYGGKWTGGHNTVGATEAYDTWYFAEGYTGDGFEEWICVLNPGSHDAELTFHFQTQEEGLIERSGFGVPAASRRTFKVNDILGEDYQTSLKLASSRPVVAERPMYFDYQGRSGHSWTGGHCVMGTPNLSNEYLFAEGTTREGFDEWITVQNPNSFPIVVTAAYQLAEGQGVAAPAAYTIDANRRHTIFVADDVGTEKDVSVRLTSDAAFLAERPMYFNYSGYDVSWKGGHCVIGSAVSSGIWFFAEGYTGPNFHQWITVQNPGIQDSVIRVEYFTQETGALQPQEMTVPANTRLNIPVNESAGSNLSLSTMITVISGPQVVAERPMYFKYNGEWEGGHDVVGFIP